MRPPFSATFTSTRSFARMRVQSATSGSPLRKPLGAEHVLVRRLPGPRVHLRDRGGVARAARAAPPTRRYLPAEVATNFATASICSGVSVPLNAGMTPPPTSTWCFTIASGGFSWSRFGPIVPLAPAAFSVWQLAQFAEKIDLPSLPAGGAAAAPGDAGRRGDVRGDVLRVLAGDEVLRHRRRRLADLVEDDVLDRALLEALLAVGRERVVEVRADRSRARRRRRARGSRRTSR